VEITPARANAARGGKNIVPGLVRRRDAWFTGGVQKERSVTHGATQFVTRRAAKAVAMARVQTPLLSGQVIILAVLLTLLASVGRTLVT
jgi:hypothetical protein